MFTMLGWAWEYRKPSVEIQCWILSKDLVLVVGAVLDTTLAWPSMLFFPFFFSFSSLFGKKNNEWLSNVV